MSCLVQENLYHKELKHEKTPRFMLRKILESEVTGRGRLEKNEHATDRLPLRTFATVGAMCALDIFDNK